MKTKSFRFNDSLMLDIDGYAVRVSARLLGAKIRSSLEKEIPACQKALEAGDTPENRAVCTDILAAWYRELFGDELFEKLFDARERDTLFFDMSDLYRYLCDSVTEHYAAQVKTQTQTQMQTKTKK